MANLSDTAKHGDRAYIYAVWLSGEFAMSLKVFKAELIKAHQARLVTLTRADLRAAMDAHLVTMSRTTYLTAEFNFVVC